MKNKKLKSGTPTHVGTKKTLFLRRRTREKGREIRALREKLIKFLESDVGDNA